jgi:hypothetical protein
MIKWKSRYKHGIYLGKPPQHSRNVAMVLTGGTDHRGAAKTP